MQTHLQLCSPKQAQGWTEARGTEFGCYIMTEERGFDAFFMSVTNTTSLIFTCSPRGGSAPGLPAGSSQLAQLGKGHPAPDFKHLDKPLTCQAQVNAIWAHCTTKPPRGFQKNQRLLSSGKTAFQTSSVPCIHTPPFHFSARFFQTFVTDICHSSSNTVSISYTFTQVRDEHVNLQDVQPLAHVLLLSMYFCSSVASPPSSAPGCLRRLSEHQESSESYKNHVFI